jgi:hypothetical protein
MRRLIADIYKMVYKLTSNKLFSLSFALLYITTLNLFTIYGICVLLTDFEPIIAKLLIVFTRPYIYGTLVLGLGFNFWLMLPLENLSKEKNKPYLLAPIILYSLVTLLLFIYTRYADEILR